MEEQETFACLSEMKFQTSISSALMSQSPIQTSKSSALMSLTPRRRIRVPRFPSYVEKVFRIILRHILEKGS